MSKVYVLNGPEIGESFELREGVSFLGRSPDNEIRLTDKTVSRKHLKVVRKGDRYLITDLKSRNGTFVSGEFLSPGKEVEVREGVPIAVGITVICLGEGCTEQMVPFLESIDLTEDPDELNRTLQMHQDRIAQNKLRFLYNASKTLTEDLSIKETLEKLLAHIFDLLRRVDRGVFVLIDPDTEEVTEIIYKSSNPGDDATTVYCEEIVKRVIRSRKPFFVSDAKTDKSDFVDTLEVLKIESVLCVPLISRSQILGAIYVDSLKRPYGFRREDLALLMNLSLRIAPAIDDARFASEILEVAEALSSETQEVPK
ncbi:MAG: FHA domain-containing protein [Deltaproteobacteria bacterium]|nr:MAG: FHA domain-containing protein [Deltaproteobacteria bacterium]